MAKKIILALAALLAILVLATLLFLRRFDPHRLGELVLDRAREATGAQIEAEEFELRIFDGLVGEQVEVAFDDATRSLRLTIDRLVLEPRLGELLRGTVAIDRIHIERPTLELREWVAGENPARAGPVDNAPTAPSSASPTADAGPTRTTRLEVEIREAELSGGGVRLETVEDGETATTSVEDLDVRLRDLVWDPLGGRGLRALSAAGDVEARSIVVGSSTLKDGSSRLAARNGLLVFENVRAATRSGPLRGRAEIDFRPVPLRYSFTAEVPDFALGPLLGGGDSSLGAASLSLGAQGTGTDPIDAAGDGRLELADGELPAAPVLLAIDALLGEKVLVGAPYSVTPVLFDMEHGLLRVPGIELTTAAARLGARGTIGFSSELDLGITLATPRSGLSVDDVGGDVLDLLTGDDGWVALPLSLTGTVAEPSVRLDKDALAEQAKRGAKRSLERLLSEGLRSLLDRDREPE